MDLSVTTDSLIPYEDYVQAALRGVVARVLRDVMNQGMPGAHHFYIAFRTRYPGVSIPKALLEKYPDEMTIVLQNRYWDLQVHDEHFEVGLSFNQVPTRVVVPYNALIGFVDPSVNFGLQFNPPEAEGMEEAHLPEKASETTSSSDQPEPPAGGEGGNVITLDRFRKKS